MTEKQAKKLVKRLAPENGWWKKSTSEPLIDTAMMLADAGMMESEIEELLRRVVTALREEYGD